MDVKKINLFGNEVVAAPIKDILFAFSILDDTSLLNESKAYSILKDALLSEKINKGDFEVALDSAFFVSNDVKEILINKQMYALPKILGDLYDDADHSEGIAISLEREAQLLTEIEQNYVDYNSETILYDIVSGEYLETSNDLENYYENIVEPEFSPIIIDRFISGEYQETAEDIDYQEQILGKTFDNNFKKSQIKVIPSDVRPELKGSIDFNSKREGYRQIILDNLIPDYALKNEYDPQTFLDNINSVDFNTKDITNNISKALNTNKFFGTFNRSIQPELVGNYLSSYIKTNAFKEFIANDYLVLREGGDSPVLSQDVEIVLNALIDKYMFLENSIVQAYDLGVAFELENFKNPLINADAELRIVFSDTFKTSITAFENISGNKIGKVINSEYITEDSLYNNNGYKEKFIKETTLDDGTLVSQPNNLEMTTVFAIKDAADSLGVYYNNDDVQVTDVLYQPNSRYAIYNYKIKDSEGKYDADGFEFSRARRVSENRGITYSQADVGNVISKVSLVFGQVSINELFSEEYYQKNKADIDRISTSLGFDVPLYKVEGYEKLLSASDVVTKVINDAFESERVINKNSGIEQLDFSKGYQLLDELEANDENGILQILDDQVFTRRIPDVEQLSNGSYVFSDNEFVLFLEENQLPTTPNAYGSKTGDGKTLNRVLYLYENNLKPLPRYFEWNKLPGLVRSVEERVYAEKTVGNSKDDLNAGLVRLNAVGNTETFKNTFRNKQNGQMVLPNDLKSLPIRTGSKQSLRPDWPIYPYEPIEQILSRAYAHKDTNEFAEKFINNQFLKAPEGKVRPYMLQFAIDRFVKREKIFENNRDALELLRRHEIFDLRKRNFDKVQDSLELYLVGDNSSDFSSDVFVDSDDLNDTLSFFDIKGFEKNGSLFETLKTSPVSTANIEDYEKMLQAYHSDNITWKNQVLVSLKADTAEGLLELNKEIKAGNISQDFLREVFVDNFMKYRYGDLSQEKFSPNLVYLAEYGNKNAINKKIAFVNKMKEAGYKYEEFEHNKIDEFYISNLSPSDELVNKVSVSDYLANLDPDKISLVENISNKILKYINSLKLPKDANGLPLEPFTLNDLTYASVTGVIEYPSPSSLSKTSLLTETQRFGMIGPVWEYDKNGMIPIVKGDILDTEFLDEDLSNTNDDELSQDHSGSFLYVPGNTGYFTQVTEIQLENIWDDVNSKGGFDEDGNFVDIELTKECIDNLTGPDESVVTPELRAYWLKTPDEKVKFLAKKRFVSERFRVRNFENHLWSGVRNILDRQIAAPIDYMTDNAISIGLDETALSSYYGGSAQDYGTRLPIDYLSNDHDSNITKQVKLRIVDTLRKKVHMTDAYRSMDSYIAMEDALYFENDGIITPVYNYMRDELLPEMSVRMISRDLKGILDMNATNPGTVNQGIVTYMTKGSQVTDEGTVLKGDSEYTAINDMELVTDEGEVFNLMEYTHHDAAMRTQMAFQSILQSIEFAPHTRVAFSDFGSFTADDGFVISKEWAEGHQIYDKKLNPPKMRSLMVGDKITDFHGNKGVINIIVDKDWPEEFSSKYKLDRLQQFFIDNPNLDVLANPTSMLSRQNAGIIREALNGEKDDLILLDGTVVKDGIVELNFGITEHLVTKKTTEYDRNSAKGRSISAQLQYILSSVSADNLIEEAFNSKYSNKSWNQLKARLEILGVTLDNDSKSNLGLSLNYFDDKFPIKKLSDLTDDNIYIQLNKDLNVDLYSEFNQNHRAAYISVRSDYYKAGFANKLPVLSTKYRNEQLIDDSTVIVDRSTTLYESIFRINKLYEVVKNNEGFKISELSEGNIYFEANHLLSFMKAVKKSGNEEAYNKLRDCIIKNNSIGREEQGQSFFVSHVYDVFNSSAQKDWGSTNLSYVINNDPILKETFKQYTEDKINDIVRDIQHMTVDFLSGYGNPKRSFFRKNIARTEIENGLTAVITANPLVNLDEIVLPQKYLDKWNVREGDYILVNRSPELQHGAAVGLKVVSSKDFDDAGMPINGIMINPRITDMMNADFDGDAFGVMPFRNEKSLDDIANILGIPVNMISPVGDKVSSWFKNSEVYVTGTNFKKFLSLEDKADNYLSSVPNREVAESIVNQSIGRHEDVVVNEAAQIFIDYAYDDDNFNELPNSIKRIIQSDKENPDKDNRHFENSSHAKLKPLVMKNAKYREQLLEKFDEINTNFVNASYDTIGHYSISFDDLNSVQVSLEKIAGVRLSDGSLVSDLDKFKTKDFLKLDKAEQEELISKEMKSWSAKGDQDAVLSLISKYHVEISDTERDKQMSAAGAKQDLVGLAGSIQQFFIMFGTDNANTAMDMFMLSQPIIQSVFKLKSDPSKKQSIYDFISDMKNNISGKVTQVDINFLKENPNSRLNPNNDYRVNGFKLYAEDFKLLYNYKADKSGIDTVSDDRLNHVVNALTDENGVFNRDLRNPAKDVTYALTRLAYSQSTVFKDNLYDFMASEDMLINLKSDKNLVAVKTNTNFKDFISVNDILEVNDYTKSLNKKLSENKLVVTLDKRLELDDNAKTAIEALFNDTEFKDNCPKEDFDKYYSIAMTKKGNSRAAIFMKDLQTFQEIEDKVIDKMSELSLDNVPSMKSIQERINEVDHGFAKSNEFITLSHTIIEDSLSESEKIDREYFEHKGIKINYVYKGESPVNYIFNNNDKADITEKLEDTKLHHVAIIGPREHTNNRSDLYREELLIYAVDKEGIEYVSGVDHESQFYQDSRKNANQVFDTEIKNLLKEHPDGIALHASLDGGIDKYFVENVLKYKLDKAYSDKIHLILDVSSLKQRVNQKNQQTYFKDSSLLAIADTINVHGESTSNFTIAERNKTMINNSDEVIAFTNYRTGTECSNAMDYAVVKNKPMVVYGTDSIFYKEPDYSLFDSKVGGNLSTAFMNGQVQVRKGFDEVKNTNRIEEDKKSLESVKQANTIDSIENSPININVKEPFKEITGKNDFNVVISGGRDFVNYDQLCETLDEQLANVDSNHNIAIVSGKAKGADSLGERYALEHGYQINEFPADWNGLGKRAGMVRNEQMAINADAVVAFWNGKSTGTRNMIELAISKKLQTSVEFYDYNGPGFVLTEHGKLVPDSTVTIESSILTPEDVLNSDTVQRSTESVPVKETVNVVDNSIDNIPNEDISLEKVVENDVVHSVDTKSDIDNEPKYNQVDENISINDDTLTTTVENLDDLDAQETELLAQLDKIRQAKAAITAQQEPVIEEVIISEPVINSEPEFDAIDSVVVEQEVVDSDNKHSEVHPEVIEKDKQECPSPEPQTIDKVSNKQVQRKMTREEMMRAHIDDIRQGNISDVNVRDIPTKQVAPVENKDKSRTRNQGELEL